MAGREQLVHVCFLDFPLKNAISKIQNIFPNEAARKALMSPKAFIFWMSSKRLGLLVDEAIYKPFVWNQIEWEKITLPHNTGRRFTLMVNVKYCTFVLLLCANSSQLLKIRRNQGPAFHQNWKKLTMWGRRATQTNSKKKNSKSYPHFLFKKCRVSDLFSFGKI